VSAVHHSARSSVLVRAVLLVALVLVLGVVATSAAPAPTSRQLDAEAVARAGLSLSWTSDAAGGARVAISRDRLLAVSADGLAVAAASGPPGTGADLVMARSDGSQIRLTALDPLGATFSPNGATVWVVSLAGALSRLDTATGAQAPVAAGPFAMGMVAANDGSLLALGLDSVEAPTRSSLVRLAPDGTVQALLPAVRIVYRVFSLDTGEVWALVHQPGKAPALIDVGNGLPATTVAVGLDLDVSPDGRYLVWTDAGEVLLASVAGGQPARSLGPGSSPRFAPTGLTVLVRRAASAAVLGIDGGLITDLTAGACWAGDGECDA
jgi:hypothetical protein